MAVGTVRSLSLKRPWRLRWNSNNNEQVTISFSDDSDTSTPMIQHPFATEWKKSTSVGTQFPTIVTNPKKKQMTAWGVNCPTKWRHQEIWDGGVVLQWHRLLTPPRYVTRILVGLLTAKNLGFVKASTFFYAYERIKVISKVCSSRNMVLIFSESVERDQTLFICRSLINFTSGLSYNVTSSGDLWWWCGVKASTPSLTPKLRRFLSSLQRNLVDGMKTWIRKRIHVLCEITKDDFKVQLRRKWFSF
jgi:hypothetical protein